MDTDKRGFVAPSDIGAKRYVSGEAIISAGVSRQKSHPAFHPRISALSVAIPTRHSRAQGNAGDLRIASVRLLPKEFLRVIVAK
jgi:hypothetical protein